MRGGTFPTKADAPLVVDRNRVLALAVPLQFVESITRRDPQVVEMGGQVDVLELAHRAPGDIGRKPFRLACNVQLLGLPIGERLDHSATVMCHVTRVKRLAVSH